MTATESTRRFASDVFSQVVLADDEPLEVSTQEGGRTIISGTFTPHGTQVKVEIDVSGRFSGWGAGGLDFHIAVVDTPTDPWEPGGKNRFVEGNFAGRGPLPGVRPGSYRHFSVGFLTAGEITPHIGRIISLDDLDPGATYEWELRCGGASFYKWVNFTEGSRPTSLAVSPDNLYVWVLLSGKNRLALVQLGWAVMWSRFGYSSDMLCVAEIPLPGSAGGIAPQPLPAPPADSQSVIRSPRVRGRYVALVDDDHHELIIVDQDTLTVDGAYPLPNGAVPSARRVLWDRFGDKIYVGGADDGRLHRFDIASRTFDWSIEVDAAAGADIVPLAILCPTSSADAAEPALSLWCSSVRHGRIVNVNLESETTTTFFQYDEGVAAPTCGVARPTTGGLVVVETSDQVRCFDAAGNPASSWKAALEDAEVRNAWTSIGLDEDEVRAFWTIDSTFGWAWIDGSHDVEPRPSGRDWIMSVPSIAEMFGEFPAATREKRVINKSDLRQFYKTEYFGDIVNTALEGTLVAIPDEDIVIQWPGGAVQIRPDDWAAEGVVGTEHASVSFTGAEATGA